MLRGTRKWHLMEKLTRLTAIAAVKKYSKQKLPDEFIPWRAEDGPSELRTIGSFRRSQIVLCGTKNKPRRLNDIRSRITFWGRSNNCRRDREGHSAYFTLVGAEEFWVK